MASVYITIIWGAKTEWIIFSQKVTVMFLYYARAVDNTVLIALSTISLEQTNLTNTTMKERKSSEIMRRHTKMGYSYTMQVKWSWHAIEIHLTSAKPRQEAVRKIFFPIRERRNPKEQWGGIKHRTNNQSGYEVVGGRKNWSNVCQCHEDTPQRIKLIKMGHPQPRTPI